MNNVVRCWGKTLEVPDTNTPDHMDVRVLSVPIGLGMFGLRHNGSGYATHLICTSDGNVREPEDGLPVDGWDYAPDCNRWRSKLLTNGLITREELNYWHNAAWDTQGHIKNR